LLAVAEASGAELSLALQVGDRVDKTMRATTVLRRPELAAVRFMSVAASSMTP
jgi:hypothetical protein